MAFNTKNIVVGGEEKKADPPTINIELSHSQLQFLLVTIKNGLFKGEYVETCYNTTLKLQEKFQELSKK